MVTRIDKHWLSSNLNSKYDQSSIERLSDYTATSAGADRVFELVEKTARLGNEISSSTVLERLERGAGIAGTGLSLTRLPFITREVVYSLWEFGQENGIAVGRKILKVIRDVMFATSSWSLALSLLRANPSFKIISQAASLTREFSEITMAANDYKNASEFAEVAAGSVKEIFNHSKDYYLLRLVKSVMSVASLSLILLSVAVGMQLLPTVAAILLSLATSIVGAHRDLFKDSGRYAVINFDRDVLI